MSAMYVRTEPVMYALVNLALDVCTDFIDESYTRLKLSEPGNTSYTLFHLFMVKTSNVPIATTIKLITKGVFNPCQYEMESITAVDWMLVAACSKNEVLNRFGTIPMTMTPITKIAGEINIPIGASLIVFRMDTFVPCFRPNKPKNKYMEYTNVKILPRTAK